MPPRIRPMLPLALALTLAAACEQEPGARPQTDFDGEAALAYARQQYEFGPRVPGTEAHRRAGDWIVEQMRQRADTVIVQSWTHVTPDGDTLPLRNILARFRPQATERVLYLTHWDTRPKADSDLDAANRERPVPGANDGASGVGLFVALADALRKVPPQFGVDLLFVDGEDWGDFDTYDSRAAAPRSAEVLLGSQYFAENPPSPDYRPMFGVLWDMIGDADLRVYQEVYSANGAPEVVQRVWGVAADLGYQRVFVPQARDAVTDDHVPLLKKGFRVINVIDIDYGGPPGANGRPNPNYHHTVHDTMERISARSLQVMGDVALTLVRPPR